MNLEHLLFLDIETVAGAKHYDDLPERMQQLWAKKATSLLRKESSNDLTAGPIRKDSFGKDSFWRELYERAGI